MLNKQKLKLLTWKSLLRTAYITLAGNRIIFPLDHQDFCKYCQHSFNEQKSDCLYMKNFTTE